MKGISPYLLLQKINSNTISQRELKQLIEVSYHIASSFLNNSYKSKFSNLIDNQDAIRDLSIDTILPLFIRNNSGILGIKRALDNWNDPILNDADVNFFLSKIIWKRADQTVTKLLKEQDPIFCKILKTLNLCFL